MTLEQHPPTTTRRQLILLALVPVALVLILYAPTFHHPFIGFDDEDLIVFNPVVAGGLTWENAKQAFTTFVAVNWHPVTTLSWQAEVTIFGMKPGPMLFNNAILHAACSATLFLVLWQLTNSRYRSLAVAVLFAVHPLRVESVAWAIERKDTLSLLFGLLTISAYARYAKRPGRLRYVLVALFFALGLMSKPMLVTWPVLLLLLDVWPLRRWRGVELGTVEQRSAKWLVVEKLPLLALSAAIVLLTIVAQQPTGAVRQLDDITATQRLLMPAANYFDYFVKTFWPWPQSLFFPYTASPPLGKIAAGLLTIVLISTIVCRRWKMHPFLAVGWGWFLLTLLPVIGLIQAGGQSIAERYSYHTSIGLLIAVVWILDDLRRRRGVSARPMWIAFTVVTIICCVATHRYLRLWASPVALFQHAIDVSSPNWLAHNQLGYYALIRKDWPEAEKQLRTSLRLSRSNDMAHHNLALVLENRGQFEEALQQIRQVKISTSAPAEPHVIAGRLLIRLGRYAEAMDEAKQALRWSPDDSRIHRQLAFLYDQAGDTKAAAIHVERVKALESKSAIK